MNSQTKLKILFGIVLVISICSLVFFNLPKETTEIVYLPAETVQGIIIP